MNSLYLELGEPIEAEWGRGRTDLTKQETETVDRDLQVLPLELLGIGGARGQTRRTSEKETIDGDQETSAWLESLAGV